MDLIEFQSISKSFCKEDRDELPVLTDINFSLNKGECFTIIGPNGSGKTTLLRILGLLEPPTSGKILITGKDVTDIKRKEKISYRRKFAFVRQKPVVLNTSVANNIAFGLKARGESKEDVYSKVTKMLNLTNLKHLANKNARSLSGGEIQRVAIAMNFIVSPELYILDEVFANLDPQNVNFLEKLIEEIKRDKEKTVLMSTHDRMEAIKFADRIGVLIDGKLSQIGTPNEIFISPKDEFTAHFVGYENIFSGIAKIDEKSGLNQIKINKLSFTASSQEEGEVKVCIRPESIGIMKSPPKNTSYRNTFKGKVDQIRDLGNICHLLVNCQGEQFLITITQLSRQNLGLILESEVYINFKATDVKIL